MRRAQRRDVHRTALAAEWQTAGRGRRGRTWTAVAGGSLTFSLGWKFEQGAGFLAGLSLAVGVAVVRALESEGFKDVALKWPNDLIHRHLKVGGILIELNGDALGPTTTVIGVGLNVRLPPSARKDIPVPVTDLASVAGRKAPPIDRNRLLAALLAELAAVLDLYASGRLRAVRRRVAASPRVPGQAGEAAAARRRDGHRQGGGRRRERRAGARRRTAPRALSLRRDHAAARVSAAGPSQGAHCSLSEGRRAAPRVRQ